MGCAYFKIWKKTSKLKHLKGGNNILKWIDDCPNDLFSALTFQGGKAWRNTLQDDFKNNNDVLKIINL